MIQKRLAEGVAHKLPADLKNALMADDSVLHKWQSLTPLARNEFICWVENAKMIDTRNNRIKRTCEELKEGKRRPCCWIGCVHRTDKSMSSSQKWVLGKKKK